MGNFMLVNGVISLPHRREITKVDPEFETVD